MHRTAKLYITATITAISLVVALSTTAIGAASAAPRRATHHVHRHPAVTAAVSETLAIPAYTPKKPNAITNDIYHCSVINPKVTKTMMITSSTFDPGSVEDHHAILYLVEPSQVAAANKLNNGGKGWTCFGAPSFNGDNSIAAFELTPWLAGWAPGHGTDVEPSGSAMPLPAGAEIVVQIHYNLLVACGANGEGPTDHPSVNLQMVPQSTSSLKPLHINLYAAPPDVPCPSGVTGALCSRSAAIKQLGQQFGQTQVGFVNVLEAICGRAGTPAETAGSNTTSCTWRATPGVLRRITPHMHLLGASMTVTLNAGRPSSRVLLSDPNYNFDLQVGYDITPTAVNSNDTVTVSCTYDASLRSLLPQLRNLPPSFITWGDASSDEMCLASVGETAN